MFCSFLEPFEDNPLRVPELLEGIFGDNGESEDKLSEIIGGPVEEVLKIVIVGMNRLNKAYATETTKMIKELIIAYNDM